MDQPPAPTPSSENVHVWPDQFTVDWKFYFVPDDTDAPPYTPLPTTPYNMTTGKTYYVTDPGESQQSYHVSTTSYFVLEAYCDTNNLSSRYMSEPHIMSSHCEPPPLLLVCCLPPSSCLLSHVSFLLSPSAVTGDHNMKEVYDSYCIPVFGALSSPMGRRNDFSCDFLNVRRSVASCCEISY